MFQVSEIERTAMNAKRGKGIQRSVRLSRDLRNKLEHVAVCVNFMAEKIRRENHETEVCAVFCCGVVYIFSLMQGNALDGAI